MGYPEDTLNGHEKLVLNLHPHWWFLTPAIAVLILSLVAGIFSLVLGLHVVIKLLIAVCTVLSLLWFLRKYAQWATTHFVLTTDRLIYRHGVLSKKGIEIPLERVNTIFFAQTIFERILGLGDLTIESASSEGASVFSDIRKPDKVQNEIYVQMEANENRKFDRVGVNQNTHVVSESIPDQIEKLHGLLERGSISQEEYENKKAELLKRL